MKREDRIRAIQLIDDILECMNGKHSLNDWYWHEDGYDDYIEFMPSREMHAAYTWLLWAMVEDEMCGFVPPKHETKLEEAKYVLGKMRDLRDLMEDAGCGSKSEKSALSNVERAIEGTEIDIRERLDSDEDEEEEDW